MRVPPHFLFTKLSNSFSVYIENLEDLCVEQIKDIEIFVKKRRGVFDFFSYTFAIQKRLEFNEFVLLIEKSSIGAVCREQVLEYKKRIEYGKYKGMYYFELPDSYLLWLKSNYFGKDIDLIDAEIKSRGL